MMPSMFSGVAGLNSHQRRMDVIANDVANVNTPGYKQSDVTFSEQLISTLRAPASGSPGMQVGTGVQVASITRDFNDGTLFETGQSSNIGIAGDGFFVVADPESGTKYFTRAGDFVEDVNTATGETYLISPSGERLQGIMDPNPDATGLTSADLVDIVLPANTTSYTIGLDGRIYASVSGGTATVIGMIPLAQFENNTGLDSVGHNLYAGTSSSMERAMVNPGNSGAGNLYQGYLENSNTNLAKEFTEMIITERGFQANSRSITTSDEMLQELLTLKR